MSSIIMRDLTNSLKKMPLNGLVDVIESVESDTVLSSKQKRTVLNKVLKALDDGTIGIEKETKRRIAFREALLNGEFKDFIMPASKWDCDKTIDYLSSEDYANSKKLLLCADMGTGKNYFWTNLPENHEYANYIMLVPYLTIVGQQGSTNKVDDDRVLTYDAARILLRKIQNTGFDTSKIILIIDEAHNLLFSSYRLEALHLVKQLINTKKGWKQVIFQSATVRSDSFDDIFTFDRKIRRRTKRNRTLNYTRAYSTCPLSQQVEICKELIKMPKDQKSLVLYNNKDGCEKFAVFLRRHGVKVAVVTAETTKKQGEIAQELAQSSDFCMGDIDVLLGTNSLVEGISIQDQIEIGNVFIMDVASTYPDHIKQLCGRFRKASIVNAIHYCATSKYNKVKNKEKWMADRRNDANIDYFFAKEWIKKQPHGSGLQAAEEIDSLFLSRDEYLNSALEKFRNRIKVDKDIKKYTASSNADFLLSYKPDLASHGIFYSKNAGKYIRSSLGDLFAYSDCIKRQFYADYKFANQLMLEMDFHILERTRPNVADDDVDYLKENNKEVGEGLKAQRLASARPIIDLIDSCDEEDGFSSYMIREHFSDIGLTWDEFHLRIYNVFDAVGVTYLIPKKDLKNAIKTMISGQKNDITITYELLASQSTYGIRADLRKQYPPGTELTKEQQISIIEDTILKMVEHISTANTGLSLEDALTHLKKGTTWFDNITIENGKVIVDLVKPFKSLQKFMPNIKSTQKRVGNERVYVARVQ